MISTSNYNYALLLRGINNKEVLKLINKYLKKHFNHQGLIKNHIDTGHLSELAEEMGNNPRNYIPLFDLLEPYHEQS